MKLPGESSDTGVLDGVGLCPGGRKCEGDPLLDPPPAVEKNSSVGLDFGIGFTNRFSLTSMKILM